VNIVKKRQDLGRARGKQELVIVLQNRQGRERESRMRLFGFEVRDTI
jgi:hypothetical protein